MKLNKAKSKTKKQTLSLMNWILWFVGYGDTNIEQSKKNKLMGDTDTVWR